MGKSESFKVTKCTIKYLGAYHEPGKIIDVLTEDIPELLADGYIEAIKKPEPQPVAPPERDNLTEIEQITPELQTSLYNLGVNTFDDLADSKETDLTKIQGITKKKAKELIKAANDLFIESE